MLHLSRRHPGNYLLCGFIFSLMLGASPPSAAQSDRWYQVEVIIFLNNQWRDDIASDERFPAQPELNYPSNYQLLIDPARINANNSRFKAHSSLSNRGTQILATPPMAPPSPPKLEDESLAELGENGETGSGSEMATGTGDSNTNGASSAEDTSSNSSVSSGDALAAETEIKPAEPIANPQKPEVKQESSRFVADYTASAKTGLTPSAAKESVKLPTPFLQQPASSYQMADAAQRLRRSGRYTLLFHQSWLQPMDAKERAPSVVIDRSGDEASWPELQGSIKLYLSRFLHAETALWINTNHNRLPSDWQMNAPPRGPSSFAIAVGNAALSSASKDSTIRRTSNDQLSFISPELGEYPYRHAVTMQQASKLRSGEVHYIDSPAFGLLIQFTPMNEEQLGQAATAEPPLVGINVPASNPSDDEPVE